LNERFPAHWLEETVDKILKRDFPLITLSTGKTPSGHIHIGFLREILICDALRRIFEEMNKKVRFLVFLDDLDAAKRFPDYIDENFQQKHKGKPFSLIPCPFDRCGCKSYAYHFGNELISTFDDFGIKNKIIWTHELYETKEMQEKIRIALEKTEEIKEILKKYILPTLDEENKANFIEMQKTWTPVMAICENCNRIQYVAEDGSIIPNRILKYTKKQEEATYKCPACSYAGKLSIYSGRLKLNWRVDWPAKWAIYKTTCEPAGKDHSVKGGSYDTGLELCQKIFNYEGPVKLPYEWLRLGDKDMKTSKGITFTPKKYLEIADPEVFRSIILRTNPMKHISLRIEEFSQYYDYYENMENSYYGFEKSDSNADKEFYSYLYPLTKIKNVSKNKPVRIPLNILIFLSQVQNILSIEKLYDKAKSIIGKEKIEKNITIEEFKKKLEITKNWIEEVKRIIKNEKDVKVKRNLLKKISLFEIPDKIDSNLLGKLDDKQINGIRLLRSFLLEHENLNEDFIQNKIFTIAKSELDIKPRKFFEAIYLVIFGKKYGPRLGSFLVLLDKDWLLERLNIRKSA
jgi:lysyl-tRNA synthetase class 1